MGILVLPLEPALYIFEFTTNQLYPLLKYNKLFTAKPTLTITIYFLISVSEFLNLKKPQSDHLLMYTINPYIHEICRSLTVAKYLC